MIPQPPRRSARRCRRGGQLRAGTGADVSGRLRPFAAQPLLTDNPVG